MSIKARSRRGRMPAKSKVRETYDLQASVGQLWHHPRPVQFGEHWSNEADVLQRALDVIYLRKKTAGVGDFRRAVRFVIKVIGDNAEVRIAQSRLESARDAQRYNR